mmetsp:Transcript_20324/g.41004  ORF Transcript_20324/g.41004 Transcript_20324/m.41004 type:complete len:382 (+) Transcript_20324:61-1206(+)
MFAVRILILYVQLGLISRAESSVQVKAFRGPCTAVVPRARVAAGKHEKRRAMAFASFPPQTDSNIARGVKPFNASDNAVYQRAPALRQLRDRAALNAVNMVPSASNVVPSLNASDVQTNVKALSLITSSAVIFEVIQFIGTAAVFYLIHQVIPEAKNLQEAIELTSGTIQQMGNMGYFVYAGVQVLFQVFPIASAFAMTVSAGVVFGSVKKGVAIVSLASSFSAAVSFLISRNVAKGRFSDFTNKSPQLKAIDTALADAGFFNSVLLMFLLRSSPVIPFSWANYLFGLSRVPFVPFVLGTLLGTLPGITMMVSAGNFGAEVISGGGSNLVVQAGLVATILSFVLIGRISQNTVKEMGIDLESETDAATKDAAEAWEKGGGD